MKYQTVSRSGNRQLILQITKMTSYLSVLTNTIVQLVIAILFKISSELLLQTQNLHVSYDTIKRKIPRITNICFNVQETSRVYIFFIKYLDSIGHNAEYISVLNFQLSNGNTNHTKRCGEAKNSSWIAIYAKLNCYLRIQNGNFR